MAQLTVNLGTLTLTSSAVDTSTQTIPALDISDAYTLGVWVNGATTAPGLQLQVAFTSESTATFVPVLYQSSAAGIVYLTSAGQQTIYAPAGKQIRVGTSNVTSTGYTIVMSKQVIV